MWWLFMLIQVVTAAIGYWWGWSRGRASLPTPWSWECTECDFAVATQDQNLTMHFADKHWHAMEVN